jgi:uncharacterized protein YjbI with pentapeptide repeats
MYIDLDKSQLYKDSSISLKLEFRSPIRRRDMASKLSKNTGKAVKWFKGVNESFKPSSSIFKLSNKYSHNSKIFVFETGLVQYHDGMRLMLQVMNIIESFGYTDDRCEMTVGISLNEKKLGLHAGISSINKFKYLIGLDENKILERWNTKETERAKMSQSTYFYFHSKNPYDTYISNSILERVNVGDFNFPESEFFGSNFRRINEGILEISYIGGKDYHRKKREASDTINQVILRLYETLSNNFSYTVDERRNLEKLVEEYRRVVYSTKTPLSLKSNYPNINLYYDLKSTDYLIESNYNSFREKIFDLVVFGAVHIADINWDNTRKVIQVKDANIGKNMVIEGVEFYNCTVEADAKNCLFSGCTIKNSKIDGCDIMGSNYIKNSKVIECKYHSLDNQISNSYIDNDPKNMIGAHLKSCLVNRGSFKIGSTVDNETEIINR